MKLRILQWNIWYKENPIEVANEIIKINPDIICAQELMQNSNQNIDTPMSIGNMLKYNYFYKESATWDNRQDITTQGNEIYSKYPITESKFTFVSPFKHNPQNAKHEGRVYIEVTIKVGKELLNVATTHLSYSYKFRNTKSRKVEADNLFHTIKNKTSNFIFTGDLNSIPKSYVINKVLENQYLKNTGPDFNKKTWTTKPFSYHGFKEDKLNWRIDHVFATKDIKIVSNKILNTHFSDHLPILVEVEI